MKKIKLTRGKYAIVDDEDYKYLNQYTWYINSVGYVASTIYEKGSGRKNQKNKIILMGKIVNKTPKGYGTIYVNKDNLDNRKCNLKTGTYNQMQYNEKLSENNTSGHKGIVWHKESKKWVAQIVSNYKRYYLGIYSNIDDAIEARKKGEINIWHKTMIK